MASNYEIVDLFPTPLFVTNTPSSLSDVIPWLDSQPMDTLTSFNNKGLYGTKSKNTYILDDPICEKVKKFILDQALILGKSLGYKCEQYKITQSWISHKKPNESHHKHFHSNSILSGVLYYGPSFDSECSSIIFHRKISPHVPGVNVLVVDYDYDLSPSPYSIEETSFNPSPGDLIIFPSYLLHSVPQNTTNKVRKSLVFNIVPEGGLGNNDGLNKLKFN